MLCTATYWATRTASVGDERFIRTAKKTRWRLLNSLLVQKFISEEYEVCGVDKFRTGRLANLTGVCDCEDFKLFEGDIARYDLEDGIEGIDKPQAGTEVNCVSTTDLPIAPRDSDVESVVEASSSTVPTATSPPPRISRPTPSRIRTPEILGRTTRDAILGAVRARHGRTAVL